ncbi:MAG: hypothetical protein Q7S31_03290 [bacterium]|nr:hypothetical protein [bacterium]
MEIIVISGPSGIGKSHLIAELSRQGVYPLKVYTDRDRRPTESAFSDRVHLSKSAFDNSLQDFLYWFEFQNNRYGYKKSDIDKHRQQNTHIAFNIPASYLPQLLEKIPEAMVIYLNVDGNFNLIKERMIKRDISPDETEEQKQLKLISIQKRLDFAQKELEKLAQIFSTCFGHPKSKIFTIHNDDTLYKEVIPYILKQV